MKSMNRSPISDVNDFLKQILFRFPAKYSFQSNVSPYKILIPCIGGVSQDWSDVRNSPNFTAKCTRVFIQHEIVMV